MANMDEHRKKADQLVPDRNLDGEWEATIFSRVRGLIGGIKNSWSCLKHSPNWWGQLGFLLRNQINIHTFIEESIASRKIHDGIPEGVIDSNISDFDEITWMRNGSEPTNEPARAHMIQDGLMLYNGTRYKWFEARALTFYGNEQMEMYQDALNLYHDSIYDWGSSYRIMMEAMDIFLQKRESGRMKFVVKSWTIMGAIVVFGSRPDMKDILMEEPLLILPMEQFQDLSTKERGHLLVEVYKKASATWSERAQQILKRDLIAAQQGKE